MDRHPGSGPPPTRSFCFCNGGPAEAQSPLLREFRPWEQAFTVVNWDQRGAGKTYGRNGPDDSQYDARAHGRGRHRGRRTCLQTARQDQGDPGRAFMGRVTGPACHQATARPLLRLRRRRSAGKLGAVAEGPGSLGAPAGCRGQRPGYPQGARRDRRAAAHRLAAHDGEARKVPDVAGRSRLPGHREGLHRRAAYPAKGDVADWIAGGCEGGQSSVPPIFAFDAKGVGSRRSGPVFRRSRGATTTWSLWRPRGPTSPRCVRPEGVRADRRRPLRPLHRSRSVRRRPAPGTSGRWRVDPSPA